MLLAFSFGGSMCVPAAALLFKKAVGLIRPPGARFIIREIRASILPPPFYDRIHDLPHGFYRILACKQCLVSPHAVKKETLISRVRVDIEYLLVVESHLGVEYLIKLMRIFKSYPERERLLRLDPYSEGIGLE